jgi:16S rRNA (uracil1498-N3)-methyltransferase
MLLFFQPEIYNNHFLNEDDSRHCVKVLRKNTKDIIHVVDGKGGLYECEITKPNDKKCEFSIVSEQKDFQKRAIYLHIAIAPTKNADRIEWFIEKCVEIGIDEISLIQTKHSERKHQKTERLEKIAISAMKQSLKAYLPKINVLVDFDIFLKTVNQKQKLIAHLTDDAQPLVKIIEPQSSYCLLIGPEGDFSKDEVIKAQEDGFQVVTLGNSRLRTETAGVVACTIFNLL